MQAANPSPDQTTLWNTLAISLSIGFALYLYFSVTLMLIARKSRTSGAGLAWIPLLNLFLISVPIPIVS